MLAMAHVLTSARVESWQSTAIAGVMPKAVCTGRMYLTAVAAEDIL